MNELGGWDNFYVILGSSAGALIGLQFVVMTLLADAPIARLDLQAGGAFGTPNVVHFAVVLLVSALVVAPWQGVAIVAILWGIVGIGGIVYSIVVFRRMRAQISYRVVFEDWLAYLLIPLAGYGLLVASAYFAHAHAHCGLFVLGAGALLLLFIGIRNAWDTVLWHVFVSRKQAREAESEEQP